MKSTILTFEAKKPLAAAQPRSRKAAGRDGGIMFAWSVIGFTSSLIMVGIAFFTYAFTHLP